MEDDQLNIEERKNENYMFVASFCNLFSLADTLTFNDIIFFFGGYTNI